MRKLLSLLLLSAFIFATTQQAVASQPDADEIVESLSSAREEIAQSISKALKGLDDTAYNSGQPTLSVRGLSVATDSLIPDSISATHTDHAITVYAPIYISTPPSQAPAILESIIQLLGVLGLFVLPILIIFIIYRYNYKQLQARNRIIETAIHNNYQIPPEYFASPAKKLHYAAIEPDKSDIRLVAVGIGGIVFFIIIGCYSVAALMLIPLIIGATRMYTSRQKHPAEKSDQYPPVPPTPPSIPTF